MGDLSNTFGCRAAAVPVCSCAVVQQQRAEGGRSILRMGCHAEVPNPAASFAET